MNKERFIEWLEEYYQGCGPDLAASIGGEDKIEKDDIVNLVCDNVTEACDFWISLTDEEQEEILKQFSL